MKTMKKSMFISTVLMVVLLIVALSTATFAWFTANNTVTATQTTMTAATSDNANITIGWTTDTMSSSISFQTADSLSPAIPLALPLVTPANTPAQYITTNITTAVSSSVAFDYLTHLGISYMTVIDAKTATKGGFVDTDNVVIGTYPGIDGTPTDLMRLYRTRYGIAQRFIRTTTATTLATSPVNTYPYLVVVADGAKIADSEIEITAALVAYGTAGGATALYNEADVGLATVVNPVVGDRIYSVDEIIANFELTAINGAAPAGFLAGGMDGTVTVPGSYDFYTLYTEIGTFPTTVSGAYYIDIDDAVQTPYNCVSTSAGERIYMTKAAVTGAARTTYSAFTTGNFFTSNIDDEYRFKADGSGATVESLTELDGAATSFYIRNDNTVSATVSMAVDITSTSGTALNDIRLAVFIHNEGDTAGVFYYAGTLSEVNSALTHYGTIVEGAPSTTNDFATYQANGNNLPSTITLDAGTTAQLSIVAWYEGVGLTTVEAGQATNFTFTFTAVNA